MSEKKQDCKLSKEHKRSISLLYGGNMPKEVKDVLGAPDKERAMHLTLHSKPKGYTGI